MGDHKVRFQNYFVGDQVNEGAYKLISFRVRHGNRNCNLGWRHYSLLHAHSSPLLECTTSFALYNWFFLALPLTFGHCRSHPCLWLWLNLVSRNLKHEVGKTQEILPYSPACQEDNGGSFQSG